MGNLQYSSKEVREEMHINQDSIGVNLSNSWSVMMLVKAFTYNSVFCYWEHSVATAPPLSEFPWLSRDLNFCVLACHSTHYTKMILKIKNKICSPLVHVWEAHTKRLSTTTSFPIQNPRGPSLVQQAVFMLSWQTPPFMGNLEWVGV